MQSVETQIQTLEERLRLAQLRCDQAALDELLDDRMLLLSDGQPFFAKTRLMEMYAPGSGKHFTSVQWKNTKIINFGQAAVVICRGEYIAEQFRISLEFMRLWLHKSDQWKLIAGTIAQPAMD